MNIQALYTMIQSKTVGNILILTKNFAGISGFSVLLEGFGISTLSLNSVITEITDSQLTFSGKTALGFLQGESELNFSATQNGDISVTINGAMYPLDFDGNFVLNDVTYASAVKENGSGFMEKITGILLFGGKSFSAVSIRNNTDSNRKFMFSYTGTLKIQDILSAAFKPIGLDISVFNIKSSFAITSLSFEYEPLSSYFLSSPDKNAEYTDDSMCLEIQTNAAFGISDKFSFSNIGFLIEKYGSYFDFAFFGDLTVLNANIKFYMTYDSAAFSLCASQLENIKLNNGISDLGGLAGISGIAENFPKDITHPENNVRLDSLHLMLSSDFKNITNFSTAVKVDFEWVLSSSPEIKVSDIAIGFIYAQDNLSLGISGNITLLGVKTRIGGGYDKKNGWAFSWRMYDNETISFSDFVSKLTTALELSETSIILPEIEIANIAFTYSSGKFSLSANILVGTNGGFFSSKTQISITSTNTSGGKRDLKAVFSYKTCGNPHITLANILNEIGISDFVSELPDFIKNIGLTQADLVCDLANSKITADILISNIGEIKLAIVFDADKSCDIIYIPSAFARFHLASLPLVGGVIPGLENYILSLQCINYSDKTGGLITGIFSTPYKSTRVQFPFGKAKNKTSAILKANTNANLNLQIGCFNLRKITAALANDTIILGFDAGLSFSDFDFNLVNLHFGYYISKKSCFFGLDGLSIDFRSPTLTIGGGFARVSDSEYQGTLDIGVKTLILKALGSYLYDKEKKQTAVLAYALLDAELGGPPAFFVTGLAAGFGYNRMFSPGTIDNLENNLLLQAIDSHISPTDFFADADVHFPITSGENFISAGIRFTTFQMMNSFALLSFNFGGAESFSLIGKSKLTVPFDTGTNVSAIAKASLLLDATINASCAAIEGQLSKDSYILSQRCRIKGGFAFYSWFDGSHADNFVLTLGGYSKNYIKPAYYPDVPRLSFDWSVSDALDAHGELYFALTPSCVMCGGALQMNFNTDVISASFTAYIDVIMQWKPYFYTFDAGISISVKADLWLFTVKFELGCSLKIWGPDFSGHATVHFGRVHFTVNFGNAENSPPSLDVDSFKKAFVTVPTINKISASQSSEGLKFVTSTCIPAETVTLQASDKELKTTKANGTFTYYLKPCGKSYVLSSTHYVKISKNGNAISSANVTITPIGKNLPSALWGDAPAGSETIPGHAGAAITFSNPAYTSESIVYSFDYHHFKNPADIAIPTKPIPKSYPEDAFNYLCKANSVIAQKNRNTFFDGTAFGKSISLSKLAGNPSAVFAAKPIIATIGSESL